MRIGPKERFEEAALAGLYLLMKWHFHVPPEGQAGFAGLSVPGAAGLHHTKLDCASHCSVLLRKSGFRRAADQTGTSLDVLQGWCLVLQLLSTQILAPGHGVQHTFLQGSSGVWTRALFHSCCNFLSCLYRFHFLGISHTLLLITSHHK